MMVLVIGPNGSGKSKYAECLASYLCTGELYYVATLLPHGDEGAARVERHRVQRDGKGFETVESPYGTVETTRRDTVLLEDMSNLIANLMFEKGSNRAGDMALNRVISLQNDCANLICVSISGLKVGDGSDEETRDYITTLQQVNDMLFERADAVVELMCGTPVLRKGSLSCV